MKKQQLIPGKRLSAITGWQNVFVGIANRVDHEIFRITIDYIVRNFDASGVNLQGLAYSFFYVLIRPSISSFPEIFKPVTYRCHEFALNQRLSFNKVKIVSHRGLMLFKWMLTKIVYA